MTQDWETRPDIDPPQSKPPRRPPWLLPAIASAAAALLTAGTVFALAVQNGESDEPPRTASVTRESKAQAPPRSATTAPPQVHHTQITKLTDICAMVKPGTLTTLVPAAEDPASEPLKKVTEKSSAAYCEWTSSYDETRTIQKERTLRIHLSLFTDQTDAVDAVEFNRALARKRSDTKSGLNGKTLNIGPYIELQDFGNEAFAQQTNQTGHGRSTSSFKLWVRYDNVAIEAEYSGINSPTSGRGRSTPLDSQLLRSRAEIATGEVIMTLRDCTSCRI